MIALLISVVRVSDEWNRYYFIRCDTRKTGSGQQLIKLQQMSTRIDLICEDENLGSKYECGDSLGLQVEINIDGYSNYRCQTTLKEKCLRWLQMNPAAMESDVIIDGLEMNNHNFVNDMCSKSESYMHTGGRKLKQQPDNKEYHTGEKCQKILMKKYFWCLEMNPAITESDLNINDLELYKYYLFDRCKISNTKSYWMKEARGGQPDGELWDAIRSFFDLLILVFSCDNQFKSNFMKSKLINGGVTNSIVSFKLGHCITYYENCAVVKEQHCGRTLGQLGMGSVDNLERIFYFYFYL